MSENNDYIQLPPLKKDTPADVVAFMWEYMKVPEDSREKVKNLLKDANENGVKISHQAPTLYDVVPKPYLSRSALSCFGFLLLCMVLSADSSAIRCSSFNTSFLCSATSAFRSSNEPYRRISSRYSI